MAEAEGGDQIKVNASLGGLYFLEGRNPGCQLETLEGWTILGQSWADEGKEKACKQNKEKRSTPSLL